MTMESHIRRRGTAALSVIAASATIALLAGCASGGGAAANTEKLVVQYESNEQHLALAEAWVDLFNEEYPDVEVELQPVSATAKQNTNLQVLTSNDAPDVGLLPIESSVYAEMSKAGALLPLAEVFEAAKLDERMSSSTVAANTYDGEQLVLSDQLVYYTIVYYNVDLFGEYGIPAPQDHRFADVDELMSAVDTLKANGVEGIAVGAADNFHASWMIDSTLSNGTTEEEYNNLLTNWQSSIEPSISYSDAPFVASIQRIKDLSDDGAFQTGYLGATVPAATALFEQGKTGMALGGSWNAGTFENTDFEYDWALLPPVDESKDNALISYVGNARGIPANAKNPDMAKKFLEVIASVEGQQAVLDAGFLPVVNDVPESAYGDLDVRLKSMLLDVASHPSQPGWSNVVPASIGANGIQPPLQELLNGSGTAQSVADGVQAALLEFRQ